MLICVSLTFGAVCISSADETARSVYLGDKQAVFVIGGRKEKFGAEVTDLSPYIEKIKDKIKQASGFAPAPVNNIYWLIEAVN